MTAQPSLELSPAAAGGRSDRAAAELRRCSAAVLIGSTCAVALLIGWRRLVAALSRPLDPLTLLLVGGLLVLMVGGGRVLQGQPAGRYRRSALGWLVVILPSAAVLGLGAALSLRGTDPIALAAFWTLLGGEELWAWQWIVRRRPHRSGDRLRPAQGDVAEAGWTRPLPPGVPHQPPAGEVVQQLTRSQSVDGSEQLTGWLRTPFALGQRTARLHVAFCPPFPKTPQVTIDQVDGPPARIKMDPFPYGARVDLKLAATAETADSVLLRFSARWPAEP